MKESTLRQLVLLLFFSTIVCLLWAAGANSRKKVELEKNKKLNERLERMTLANTVITDNLKQIQNKIAALQQKEYELKQNIKQQEQEKQQLEEKIDDHGQSAEDLEVLKKANTTLGEELLRLKAQDMALRQELEMLKTKKKASKKSKNNDAGTQEKESGNQGNFAW